MKREIDHFEVCDGKLYVLSDDGLLFEMGPSGHWIRHPPLPEAPDNFVEDENRGDTMLGRVMILLIFAVFTYFVLWR